MHVRGRYSGHFRRKATVRLAHDEIVIVGPALIPGRNGVTSAFVSGGRLEAGCGGRSQSFARRYDDAGTGAVRPGGSLTMRRVPARPTGWPVLRTPTWMFAAGA